jgi:CHRD domain
MRHGQSLKGNVAKGYREAFHDNITHMRLRGGELDASRLEQCVRAGSSYLLRPPKRRQRMRRCGRLPEGRPQGFGSATIIIALPDTVCWRIVVDGLTSPPSPANLAHIHRGVSGLNGPIVVNLFPPPPVAPSAGNPGASSGCTSGVAAKTLIAIGLNPTGFYVNVHNAPFPAGAVRGQLQ